MLTYGKCTTKIAILFLQLANFYTKPTMKWHFLRRLLIYIISMTHTPWSPRVAGPIIHVVVAISFRISLFITKFV